MRSSRPSSAQLLVTKARKINPSVQTNQFGCLKAGGRHRQLPPLEAGVRTPGLTAVETEAGNLERNLFLAVGHGREQPRGTCSGQCTREAFLVPGDGRVTAQTSFLPMLLSKETKGSEAD